MPRTLLPFILSQSFYINYVICKLFTNVFTNFATSCFILTMWYVNLNSALPVISWLKKFYINYVICKLSLGKLVGSDLTAFYINYVICKFVKKYIKKIENKSFILTMWYVNR